MQFYVFFRVPGKSERMASSDEHTGFTGVPYTSTLRSRRNSLKTVTILCRSFKTRSRQERPTNFWESSRFPTQQEALSCLYASSKRETCVKSFSRNQAYVIISSLVSMRPNRGWNLMTSTFVYWQNILAFDKFGNFLTAVLKTQTAFCMLFRVTSELLFWTS